MGSPGGHRRTGETRIVAPREEVRQILRAMAADVLEKLDAAGKIEHPGESGRAREGVIRDLLGSIVPSQFGIDTGFAIDARGRLSEQLDIVLYRTGYHPIFEVGGVKYFPIESIAAVIQNRTSLTSRAGLRSALKNLESVKALDRTGDGTNYALMGAYQGRDVDPEDFNFQVWTAILTESSLSRNTLAAELMEWLNARPRRLWPNMYVDVRRFSSFYRTPDGGAHARPNEAVSLNLTRLADDLSSPSEPPLSTSCLFSSTSFE